MAIVQQPVDRLANFLVRMRAEMMLFIYNVRRLEARHRFPVSRHDKSGGNNVAKVVCHNINVTERWTSRNDALLHCARSPRSEGSNASRSRARDTELAII